MNKSELVSRLTERLGGDRTIATAAVNGVLAEIESSVARGERVSLIGFGTFDRRERAPRTGRNPQTGAAIQLPASVAPVFRPGVGFRSLLTQNGGSAAVVAVETAPPATKESAKATAKKPAAATSVTKVSSLSNGAKSGKKTAKKATKKATGKDAKKAAKKGR